MFFNYLNNLFDSFQLNRLFKLFIHFGLVKLELKNKADRVAILSAQQDRMVLRKYNLNSPIASRLRSKKKKIGVLYHFIFNSRTKKIIIQFHTFNWVQI